MTIPATSSNKQQLRGEIRQLLRGAPRESEGVREALRRWLAARPALRTVALFAALPGEIDLLPLLASAPDRRWLFPRVCGEDLVFCEVRDPACDLQPGSLGIREPSPALPGVPLSEIDVFLCPGLAFDPLGGRLGRGRGYYDRALAASRPDALKLGICHPCQLVADTFPQAHDVIMDAVISGADTPTTGKLT
ncbi:MAG: 5-formyltetrahydrofolate cyclo-ligase [Verrucomicrobiota bacterium]